MKMLFSGGCKNGKSTLAEDCARALAKGGPLYYLATMIPRDEEDRERIRRHVLSRAGKGFETVERYTDIGGLTLPADGTALVECLCNLTANEMFEPEGVGEGVAEKVIADVLQLAPQCRELVVVTNDIMSAGSDYDAATRAYMQALGKINAALSRKADRVLELVAGIPILLKGELPPEENR